MDSEMDGYPGEPDLVAMWTQRLAPEERCHLDGRIPVDPKRLQCGHVYCRLCFHDMILTAALTRQVPMCKTCYGVIAPGEYSQPTDQNESDFLQVVNNLQRRTLTQQPLSGSTLGSVVGRTLNKIQSPTLPLESVSAEVMTLHSKFIKTSAGAGAFNSDFVETEQRLGSEYNPQGIGTPQQQENTTPSFDSMGIGVGEAENSFDLDMNEWLDYNAAEIPGAATYATAPHNASFDAIPPHSSAAFTNAPPMQHSEPPHIPSSSHPPAPVPHPQPTQRDISILAGLRFVFKGTLNNQRAMEDAVRNYGGVVTGAGYKHTDYGIVGQGWKPPSTWQLNNVVAISEEQFWELLERKVREAREARGKKR